MLRRTLALTGASFALITATAGATERVWSQTGPTTAERHFPTLSVLPDGRALMAGGGPAGAEIYDPATNAWGAIGAMAHPRSNASAVSLRDGRVLVVGGTGELAAEIYDPAANTWTKTRDLHAPQYNPKAVLLADGRVLSLGAKAEIYDPATDVWTLAPALRRTRTQPTVVALRDGRALVTSEGTAETYDPVANAWTLTAPMLEWRRSAGGTLLPDGRVLIAGGENAYYDDTSDTSEIFDPMTGAWTAGGKLAHSHGKGAVLITLADGSPLLIGGGYWHDGLYHYRDLAERYDVATGKWTPTVAMADYHWGHAAVALPDGSAVVAGGQWSGTVAERFVPLEVVVGGPVIVPPGPSIKAPAPETTVPAPVGVAAFTHPFPRRLKLSRGTVGVKLHCSGGPCEDRVVLKRWRTTLASGAFEAADGQTLTVKLKVRGKRLKAKRTSVTLELARQKTTLFASLHR